MDRDDSQLFFHFRLRGEFEGRALLFDLPEGESSVGSAVGNDLRLSFTGVSRKHALVRASGGGLVVEDLGSKNGTFVDGESVLRVAAGEGSRLAFGPVELTVVRLDAGADLAIRFDRPVDEGSSLAEHEMLETLLVELTTEGESREVALLDEAARYLQSGDLPGALGSISESLGLDGIFLVRWSEAHGPLAVESWGRAGSVPSLDQLLDLPIKVGDSAGNWYSGAFDDGLVVACQSTAVDGSTVGLVLWGVDREIVSIRFVRVMVRLLSMARGEPHEQIEHRPAHGSRLRFPRGYVVARSAEMQRLYRQMEAVCRLRQPVLLHGETGVGKEMLARSLHDSSSKPEAPYVTVSCAAIAENLLEAEMFGIVVGAATGVAAREGYFARAEGGTLFLDEIGELTPALQAKLLRTLQEGEIQPVGGRPRAVDVWVIAATNVDLQSDRLRRDLYYRLAAGLLEVPPLRRCRDDIPGLVRHYVSRAADETGFQLRGMTTRALDHLCRHPWPGNTRQLVQVVRRLVALEPAGGIIDEEALPENVRRAAERPEPDLPFSSAQDLQLKPRVEALERGLIREAMIRTGGHRLRSSKLLGISRGGLAKKLKRLGLEKSWAKAPARDPEST